MGATLLSVNRPNPNGRSIKVSVPGNAGLLVVMISRLTNEKLGAVMNHVERFRAVMGFQPVDRLPVGMGHVVG